ncbi:MAG: efflux RND transporter periplasmic adaptor subunit [Lachnospiraceae bacterium]|nr:efflux RND transporter periplasmic adaptor subunit [Lachnospiraceae bacterium]
MKKRRILALISYSLIFSIFLTGCGKTVLDEPELVEPIAVNESYRPVAYGDIGEVIIENGVVVPRDYCHFWTVSTAVAEVKVEMGEYVEKGQVLAVANIQNVSENILAIKNQISLETNLATIQDEKYEYDKKELEYKLQGCKDLLDAEGEQNVTTQLAVLEENHNYDVLLRDYKIKSLNESLNKQEELMQDSNLVANHSGYVTYIKDLSMSDVTQIGENVVIISDYEDSYIEISEVTIDEKYPEKYPIHYTVSKGEKCELEEYEYLADELMVSQSRSLYPELRMKYVNLESSPEIGSIVPVFFMEDVTENVLVVGNDSLYQDSQGDFVYVKTDGGKEVRYVELGNKDKNYTEVLSGLEEGELVYYSSEAMLPAVPEEYVVEYTDYKIETTTKNYKIVNTESKKSFSEYEGVVNNVYVEAGDDVESGDLLYTVETNEGNAYLTELRNNISAFEENHKAMVAYFDEEIAKKEQEMEEAFLAASKPPEETIATDTDAEPEKIEPYLYEQLSCQLEKLKLEKKVEELNYIYQIGIMKEEYNKVSNNNNGNGIVNVYAPISGKVSILNVRAGKNIKAGDYAYTIATPSSNRVEIVSDKDLRINQKITFVNSSGKEYEGKVIGTNQGSGNKKIYFTHINDKVFITENAENYSGGAYYVHVENENFYNEDGSFTAIFPREIIYDTVVLPNGMVYSEISANKLTVRYYVWKKVDDVIEKHYVQYYGGIDANADTVPENMADDCVISGIYAGDILIREKQADDTEE